MYGNWWHNYSQWSYPAFAQGTWSLILIPLVFWSLFWKGWALWLAARSGSKPWFIVLLIVNTAGILDILYIFFFGKKKSGRK